MAFRTRRQQRYELLRNKGFLPFEAQVLSAINIRKTPYMSAIIRDRASMYARAVKGQVSKAAYKKAVMQKYVKKGWMVKDDRRKVRLTSSVWTMVRSYEDKYKARFPAYKSPNILARKGNTKTIANVERSIKGDFSSKANELKTQIASAKSPREKSRLEKRQANLKTWA